MFQAFPKSALMSWSTVSVGGCILGASIARQGPFPYQRSYSTQTSVPERVAPIRRVTTKSLQRLKENKTPITFLTAYDYTSAMLVDAGGVDAILVGDSASNVMAGNMTTLPITLDQMIYHAQCVVKGTRRALVVVDLPFGSYQGNSLEALNSAIRVMKETGASAVKLEGGEQLVPTIERILSAGIPVMGHVGLTPQSINKFGTYTVRGQESEEQEQVKRDVKALEKAGCFSIVLEKIPWQLSQELTNSINIPTIGIGAGPHVDGQVLVMHDMLGLSKDFNPRFIRRYADLDGVITSAVSQYVADVRSGSFPSLEESYSIPSKPSS